MVKGVQKKIIEVNHPDSLYFERAVFYLKPGVTQLPQQLSRADADALLGRLRRTRRKNGSGCVPSCWCCLAAWGRRRCACCCCDGSRRKEKSENPVKILVFSLWVCYNK